MYKIELSKQVQKFLLKCDNHIFEGFEKNIEVMKIDFKNRELDIKKLKGTSKKYRLRVSKYRFLFEVDSKNILIYFYKADSRGDVYK